MNEAPIPRLPWKTVSGPFRWVDWTARIVFVLSILLLIIVPDNALVLLGLGLSLLGASCAYEALRTGTARSQGMALSFVTYPKLFWVLVCSHLLLAGLGAVLFLWEFR